MNRTFPKSDRVCSATDVAALFRRGRSFQVPLLRIVWLECPERSGDRIVVSVPKRLFKRAVRRNLLKRRIREAYRLQRSPRPDGMPGRDILIVYASKEIASYETIRQSVRLFLERLA